MEILLIIFLIMVAFSSFKLIIKIFWRIMAPLSTLGAIIVVLYLFSLIAGK